MLCQKFFVTSQQLFLEISPDSARDGSFGGFYVKVQIIYYTDKQLVRYLLNIPNYLEGLGATDPQNSPNYQILPSKEPNKKPSRTNRTTTPVFTKKKP